MEITLEDLNKAIQAGGNNWSIQNNILDEKTKFIYDVKDFNTLQLLCNTVLKKEDTRQYAYHRWVNFQSSKYCEQLFCKYGAIKADNYKDKEKDIIINSIPYDVKLTVYPAALQQYDLSLDKEKDKLIKWLYYNQSKEGRNHYKNRVFIVCGGDTKEDRMKNKIKFLSIEDGIKKWMNTGFQKMVKIKVGEAEEELYSDIIYIK